MSEPIQRGSPDWRKRVADRMRMRAGWVREERDFATKRGIDHPQAECPACGSIDGAGLCEECILAVADIVEKGVAKAVPLRGGTV